MLAIPLMLLVYFFYTGAAFLSTLLGQDRFYYWLATAVWLVLFVLLLARHGERWVRIEHSVQRRVCDVLPAPLRRGLLDPWVVTLTFVGIGAAYVITAQRQIAHYPMVLLYTADPLPLIQAAVRNFLHGADPYRGYRISQEVHLTYLPGLWMTYIPAELMRVDYRWTAVAAQLGVLAVWWRWWLRTQRHLASCAEEMRLACSIQTLLFAAAFFLSAGQRWFSASMHTPPEWLWLAMFFYSAAFRNQHRASLLLGLCCASRQTAFVLVPVWLIYVWMNNRQDFAKHIALWAALPVALLLPFFLWNPSEFFFGTVKWYGISSAMSWNFIGAANADTFGITGMLYWLGLLRYAVAVQIVGLIVVYALAAKKIRHINDVFAFLCWSLIWFSMTTYVSYSSLYLPVFLLLSLTLLARWGDEWRIANVPASMSKKVATKAATQGSIVRKPQTQEG